MHLGRFWGEAIYFTAVFHRFSIAAKAFTPGRLPFQLQRESQANGVLGHHSVQWSLCRFQRLPSTKEKINQKYPANKTNRADVETISTQRSRRRCIYRSNVRPISISLFFKFFSADKNADDVSV